MKKIIFNIFAILIVICVANNSVISFEHPLHNTKDYFKSRIQRGNVKHLILFTILKEYNGAVVPIVKKPIPLIVGNIYYVYYENDNIYYQINNMFVQDKQQKRADLVIRPLPDSTLRILIPSLGRVFKTSVNETNTFPVPNLAAMDGIKGFYNLNYIKSY